MNESSVLVCIPLPSPFLSPVGEWGGQAVPGSQSVLESQEAEKHWPGALLALAWQSTWSILPAPGDPLRCAAGATPCSIPPKG